MKLFNLVLYLVSYILSARAWDLAVAAEGVLEFMTADGKVTSKVPQQFSDLSAVTFDPTRNHVYLSDTKNNDSSIFRLDVETSTTVSVVPKQVKSVQGIAYDPNTTALYWTNGHGRTISMMKADDKEPTTIITFNNDEIPRGIAVDNCHRFLYWANSNHLSASIERASLDGSGREVIIKDDLFQPIGIAVDQSTNKLYWSDDREGIYFRIERSNLDGSDRETLVESSYHQPFALSVGPERIYWSDWVYKAVWSVPKVGRNHEAKMIRRYNGGPMGLVARISTECHDKIFESEVETSSFMSDDSTTSSHVTTGGCDASVTYCLNDGSYDAVKRECKCRPGFNGMRCEIPACFNYCVHGSCFLDSMGYAQCQCELGYKGDRCHVDVCEGYCLNGGRCDVERGGEPVCKCSQYVGQRCETSTDVNLVHYDITDNSSSSMLVDGASAKRSCIDNELHQVILVVLGSVIVVMMMVIMFLVRKVCLLRKRPRIKKHIIVNKSVRPTPLTSRPANQGEQCEITIENCCNMNICETPCFEPQLRTSKSQSKTEEKKNLLGSMEESSSCMPSQEDLY